MFNIDNNINIHGRLVRDITAEESQSGVIFAQFTVAVDRRGKNDADKTDYFECITFGESAKALEKYFYRGKPIRVSGRMECDPYTGKDGTKRYPWKLKVDAWGFDMGEPKNSGKSQNIESVADTWEEADADIPFDI